MSSSVLESVPVDRITAQARATVATVHPGHVLMAMLAWLFVAPGWLAAQSWFALVWAFTAVKVGWTLAHEQRQNRSGPRGPAR